MTALQLAAIIERHGRYSPEGLEADRKLAEIIANKRAR